MRIDQGTQAEDLSSSKRCGQETSHLHHYTTSLSPFMLHFCFWGKQQGKWCMLAGSVGWNLGWKNFCPMAYGHIYTQQMSVCWATFGNHKSVPLIWQSHAERQVSKNSNMTGSVGNIGRGRRHDGKHTGTILSCNPLSTLQGQWH